MAAGGRRSDQGGEMDNMNFEIHQEKKHWVGLGWRAYGWLAVFWTHIAAKRDWRHANHPKILITIHFDFRMPQGHPFGYRGQLAMSYLVS